MTILSTGVLLTLQSLSNFSQRASNALDSLLTSSFLAHWLNSSLSSNKWSRSGLLDSISSWMCLNLLTEDDAMLIKLLDVVHNFFLEIVKLMKQNCIRFLLEFQPIALSNILKLRKLKTKNHFTDNCFDHCDKSHKLKDFKVSKN